MHIDEKFIGGEKGGSKDDWVTKRGNNNSANRHRRIRVVYSGHSKTAPFLRRLLRPIKRIRVSEGFREATTPKVERVRKIAPNKNNWRTAINQHLNRVRA